jgi:hypothetical protein
MFNFSVTSLGRFSLASFKPKRSWLTNYAISHKLVRFQMRSLNILNSFNPAALWPWGLTQTRAEINTKNRPDCKVRPVRKAHPTASVS